MTTVVINNRSALKQKIKDKARERILAILPEWKQTNLVARGVQFNRQALTPGSPALTAQELAEIAYMEGEWAKVIAIRQHSDSLEVDVDNGVAVDLDSGWPF